MYLRNYLTQFLTNNDKIIDFYLDFQQNHNNYAMNVNVTTAITKVSFTNFHSEYIINNDKLIINILIVIMNY